MKKVIAVVGSTGAQGGGLVRSLLADPSKSFGVRAITRKPEGVKARELARLGAEVFAADIDDVAALERAFAGAHGAFCVTNFWEHFSADKELQQAQNLARACKAAGVQHVVWSTLDDTRKKVPLTDQRMPTLQEKYKVPHFDAKGEADDFFRAAGVPTTFLLTCFFWENFAYFGMGPKKGPDGKWAIVLPLGERKLPGVAAEDIGKCVHGVFQRGSEFLGKTIGIAGEHLTGAEMATTLSRTLEKEISFHAVPWATYRGFGFPGADDLANMFQYKHDLNVEYCAARDVALSRSLNPQLQSFAQWAVLNKSRIPLE